MKSRFWTLVSLTATLATSCSSSRRFFCKAANVAASTPAPGLEARWNAIASATGPFRNRRRRTDGNRPTAHLTAEALDESDFDDDDDLLLAIRDRRRGLWSGSRRSASADSITAATKSRGGASQRSSQGGIYSGNVSRRNFPKPPYRFWNPQSDARHGTTTFTGKLFALNLIVFGLQTMYPSITRMGAKQSDVIREGRQLYRLLTPVFLHGGIGHLFSNSYSLRAVGPNVEKCFGPARFLATYVVSGIAGNVLSTIYSPNPAVGASGAIFGLVGAYYTFLSQNEGLMGYAGEMQRSSLVETMGFNMILGMMNPMIDNWGHLGGFIGGVGMAYYFGPRLYMARLPNGARVVVDRPIIPVSAPPVIGRAVTRIGDGFQNFGDRVRGFRVLGGSDREFSIDADMGEGWKPTPDDDIYVTPTDPRRRNVTKSRGYRPRGRSVPMNKSIRPRYRTVGSQTTTSVFGNSFPK